jgi:DNA-binding NarL/FixJ family response regulator
MIMLEKSDMDHFRLVIRDTGVGIPKEKYDFIFERFTQISDNVQGSGIGLSLVKDIIMLLDGTIEVESEVEKGSSFIVTIPLGDCTESQPIKDFGKVEEFNIQGLGNQNETVNRDSEFEKNKKTILAVEDNVNMREFLVEVLKGEYNVMTAGDGNSALKKLMKEEMKIDLIISDVMMPNLDGKEFFNRIKDDERYKDIPFIFLTAKARFEDKIEGLRDGAMDYIYKPFSIEELLAKIDTIIRKKDSIKEAYKKAIKKSIIGAIDEDMPSKYESEEADFSKFNITPREEEIIKLILKGEEYKDISVTLNISINTVNNHIQNIYRKLDIQNRMELINLFK